MSKPEDIPQDVWEAAEDAFDTVLCNDIQASGTAEQFRIDSITPVARAIMAERERCAAVADTYFMRWENDGSAYWLERRMHSEEIAGAIRKGTP